MLQFYLCAVKTAQANVDNHNLSRFKDGDPKAFTYFFDLYWEELYTVAFRHLREEAQAKDLVQEVFIHIWEKRQLINSDYTSLKSYLYKSVKNKILNFYATERVRKQVLEKSVERMELFSNLDDHNLAKYKALEAIVDNSIDKLPKLMKSVYLMRFDNYSIAQIAQELNIAEQTVKNYLSDAKKIMRNELTQRFADHDSIYLLFASSYILHYYLI
ncbi:sigma-70 family RNA polymerase sigma factor [Sphingobacterium sp.]|uniref:RNA polymerase sigma factor n=1 Tax=Sphingobacterium sp. TaxID=341027 RepID=UPI0028A2D001|nr:sigma-70 family RNA polymerase sigma factor [Sphingobacterium sp.]